MRRGSKKLLVLALVFGIPLAVLGVWLALILIDEPPPDDSDLRIQRADIPEADNGYTHFIEADKNLKWPRWVEPPADAPDKATWDSTQGRERVQWMLKGKGWDAELADKVLKDNEEAFGLIRRGLECRQCQAPFRRFAEESSEIGLFSLGDLGLLRTLTSQHRGKHSEALASAMEEIEIGQRIQGAGGGLIVYTLGGYLKRSGLETLRTMVADTTIGAPSLKKHAGLLGAYVDRGENLARALRVEYEVAVTVVEDCKAGTLLTGPVPVDAGKQRRQTPPSVFMRENATKRLFAETFRALVANAPRYYTDVQPPPPPYGGKFGVVQVVFSRNPTGLWLYAVLTGQAEAAVLTGQAAAKGKPYYNCVDSRCANNAELGMTRLLLAMRAYRIEKGRLPETLNELVPEYLDVVPVDEFDGKPLRYNPAKRVVYSVGMDLKDEGGSTRADWLEARRREAQASGTDFDEDMVEFDMWDNLPDPGFAVPFE